MTSDKKAAVIRCVDERYSIPALNARFKLPIAFDLTAVGGTKRFVERETWRREFFEQVRELISVGKNITKIILVDHFDTTGTNGCAAYGEDDSRERHEQNLRRAAELIATEPGFEDFDIQLLLHDINRGKVHEVRIKEPAEMVGVS